MTAGFGILQPGAQKTITVSVTGCWLLSGYLQNGYGRLKINGTMHLAHRVAYERLVGPIPADCELDHLCRVRHCLNPDHLEVVTRRENVMRSPIAIAAVNARKTHCKHGHPLDEGNVYVRHWRGFTWRNCRRCSAASHRKHHQERVASATVLVH